MAISLRRKRDASRGRYTPNLWPVWIVAPVAMMAVGVAAWAIYQYAYDHFAQAAGSQVPAEPVDVNDVIKATVTVLTLVGAVLAGLYAYRKQLLSEGDAHRADASQLADRYTTAAEQLGHDQAAVRLAGVYALARLADDWQEQRQVCIDVLCAYLRMPYESSLDAPGHRVGEREVRFTVINVIRTHLQDRDANTSWCGYRLDFTGAVFDGGNFSGSHFDGPISFSHALFADGTVDFRGATFSGGEIDFSSAKFNGRVWFTNARFIGGIISFNQAEFNGGNVYFAGAHFTGSTLTFLLAKITDGMINFASAELRSGALYFNETTFSGGTVRFDNATFSGIKGDFRVSLFNGGTVSFANTILSAGTLSFANSTHGGGAVRFTDAAYDGTVIDWGPFPNPASN
ncbi:hypothetical protein B0675_39310 [Streptomyces sp. M41(2017)]|uniref:pentapeptide repeat-containing protein n=1 Tax=Streptomyces sp. M41(2017) TaxID=1955065 RepID=UPI0009BE1EB0|nr:pentapeptide repeat-containing protein [Streptomyces sp. M41(2017)]OQQ13083.1 hypothetical protein B0675_39310 [Streptomyces sp. M41(2017)]